MPSSKANTGPKNHNWRGGRVTDPRGYILIRVGADHHLADVRGYAYEHRLVAEGKIGRRLRRGEQVHHVNGDVSDNRQSNLEVCPSHAHHAVRHRQPGKRLKHPDESNRAVQCACGCGATFKRFDRWGRPRRYVSGHNWRRSDG